MHWLIYKMLIIKKNPEKENSDEVINIAEKILNFNKQQKCKGPKILTSKQMIQRLPIALTE